jgi:integrase
MRGHIAKKGNKYYIVVDMKDELTGARKRKWLSGYEKKRDAEKALPEILKELNEGTFKEPTDETFGTIMSAWLEDKKSAVRPGTWKSYSWLVETHLIPHLGKIKLVNLQAKQLHNLYHKTLLPVLSAASIRKLHVLIIDALNRSVTWGDIPRNVAIGVELPKGKKVKFEVWNEEQLQLFLDTARSDQYYTAFELAASTGMRQSEILGLRWVDVDLNNKTISVRQAYTKAESGHEIDDTKSETSERSIALFPETIKQLREHRTRQNEEHMENRKVYRDYGLVIQTRVGTPVNPRNLMRNFYKIIDEIIKEQDELKSAEKPYLPFHRIRFHDLRHTHATILLKNGAHPKIVQERLGHSSVNVTLDVYSHVLPNMQEALLQSIGNSITGGKNKNVNSL